MNEYTKNAKLHLENSESRLTFCNKNEIHSSKIRGVLSLVQMVADGESMQGFYCADKVVGKAAAFMYAILKPEELYAFVLSEKAEEVLKKYSIKYFYGEKVPAIINRKGDGFCPMEEATEKAESPEEAYKILIEKLKINPSVNQTKKVEVPI